MENIDHYVKPVVDESEKRLDWEENFTCKFTSQTEAEVNFRAESFISKAETSKNIKLQTV